MNRQSFGLDLFCGTGYGTYLLSEHLSCSVLGIDASQEAIAFAGEHFSTARTLHAQKIFPFELPRSKFDFVTCFESLEHVDEWSLLLDELAAALKPAGALFLSIPNEAVLSLGKNPNRFHVRHFQVDEILGEAAERGLDTVSCYGQDAYVLEDGRVLGLLVDSEVGLQDEKLMQFSIFEFRKGSR